MKKDLVIEIGTEELPSSVVALCKGPAAAALLAEYLLGGTELYIGGLSYNLYATPRRIIMQVKDLPQTYNKVEVGPPKKIAYDENSKPSRALEGFLKKIGAKESDIVKSTGSDNEKVTVIRQSPVKGLITERFAKVIKHFEGYKTLVWESENPVRFPRPIRWILALHGAEIIPLKTGNISAGNITYPGRTFSESAIKVNSAQDFFKILDKCKIVYDFEKRKTAINSYLEKNNWHRNPQLIDEVASLVEYPVFTTGSYDKEYLKLPQEVLVASMSKNQRIFPLEGKNGNFINKFAAVLNGNLKNKNNIKQHYEQVLDAKLKDALFFYNEDLNISLTERSKNLNGIVFHKKLGTYADKVKRLAMLIGSFKEAFNLQQLEYEKFIKAASLCKADLLTQMVGEFPSLQGVMGKCYALREGIDKEIATAIEEHYRPRFSDDKLPESKLGSILALLDKFDSVICHFKAGNQPQGNKDLYALRRQSIGIINIILQKNIKISLSEIFDKVFEISPAGASDKEALKKDFMDFIRERLIVIMGETYKFRHDLIDAVLASGFDDICKFNLRIQGLNNIIDEFYFEQARCVVERTYNITKGALKLDNKIDNSLLSAPEERELYDKYKEIKDKVKTLIEEDKYNEATRLYADKLSETTHNFFDKVMVNTQDIKVRDNRLKLLRQINNLYTEEIADLAKIVKPGVD